MGVQPVIRGVLYILYDLSEGAKAPGLGLQALGPPRWGGRGVHRRAYVLYNPCDLPGQVVRRSGESRSRAYVLYNL